MNSFNWLDIIAWKPMPKKRWFIFLPNVLIFFISIPTLVIFLKAIHQIVELRVTYVFAFYSRCAEQQWKAVGESISSDAWHTSAGKWYWNWVVIWWCGFVELRIPWLEDARWINVTVDDLKATGIMSVAGYAWLCRCAKVILNLIH